MQIQSMLLFRKYYYLSRTKRGNATALATSRQVQQVRQVNTKITKI